MWLLARSSRTKRYEEQFGPKAEWVRSLDCHTCGKWGPSDPAHMRSRGAGGTSEHLVPLCRVCHMRQHSKGIKTFFREYGVDDHMALAKEYHERWLGRLHDHAPDPLTDLGDDGIP